MAKVLSQPPARFTSGFVQDQSFQPLHNQGAPNPLFYQQDYDDFVIGNNTGTLLNWLVTLSGTGANVFPQANPGGTAHFTSGSTAGVAELQRYFAMFQLPQVPKKAFFMVRLNATAWATAGLTILAGLIQSTTTPGTVTDGIYFLISPTGVITLNSTIASATTSVTLPANSYSLVANTNVDLAWALTRTGDILAYVDNQLVGYVPQSNIGTPGNPQNAGAVARITAPAITTAQVAPTVAFIQTGTTVVNMNCDFILASVER